MNDPIVDEVRRVREAHAARFNFDLDLIFRDVKEQEAKSGRTFVSLAPPERERTESAPPVSDNEPSGQADAGAES
jgi:hypothetical protein